ncbi:HK97-gp10 family putative phage morphogenesis protein [Rhizobium sp. RM]|uniref:HK97-gp10 family putative phage morphogenesis protein n=1 Tax=Rhizobium sp. RM TaxID=2748079 RepID=UPI00110E9F9B|nr:HK97-gp10 family putative phage morphogenesis protein [Rhizobium sp. RM]NWJ24768.1 HK97 gp10 family phage protein [Rhizobium sp. RM]TMV16567.1 HK97 gp10 family phage protein [Rhizobium sp. Td3]
MRSSTTKITGLKELDRALGQLPEAVAKQTLRRVLKEAAEPLARRARQLAPRDEFHLYDSVDVSTRLSKRQSALHKKEGGQSFQEMFVGTNNPAGVQQEFGNDRHAAQPFMRPAWDGEQVPTLDRIANSLWTEIEKSARRNAKRG